MDLGEATRLYQAALEEARQQDEPDPEIITEVARTYEQMEVAWLEHVTTTS